MERPLRLVLLRHAKSDWSLANASDFARPLNARGRRDAPRIGAALRDRGFDCEHVLCSAATRARETWAAIAPIWSNAPQVSFHESLYHAGIVELRAALATLPPATRSAMVVGHNPGWEEAVLWLCGHPHELKTGTAAVLEGPVGWDPLHPGAWTLVDLISPNPR